MGINKNGATPAWGLWSSAITCWTWLIFHGLNDVWDWSRGWGIMRDLGGNNAAMGIGRSLVVAVIITVIAALLYRRRVRIRI